MGDYDDIIRLPAPNPRRHPRMPVAHRAKQFMPFAALRGYDDVIEARQVLYVPRSELSEDEKQRLDGQLRRLAERLRLGKRPKVTLEYFVPAEDPAVTKGLGRYQRRTARARKLLADRLVLEDGEAALSDLSDLLLPDEPEQ